MQGWPLGLAEEKERGVGGDFFGDLSTAPSHNDAVEQHFAAALAKPSASCTEFERAACGS